MADGEVAVERREPALVEDLGDEAHVLDDGDGLAVAHRDPRRLLAAVLEGEETQVGEVGDRVARCVDPEDAAGLARSLRSSLIQVSHAGRGGSRCSSRSPPDWPTTTRASVSGSPGSRAPGRAPSPKVVVDELRRRGHRVELLDGDEVRENLSKGLGFSKEDRDTNIRRIGWVAAVLARNGVVAVAAAISPYRDVRDEVRAQIDNFVEVYVDTPLDVCEERDVKGLYAKARAATSPNSPGCPIPYEAPLEPEVRVVTHDRDVAASAAKCSRTWRSGPRRPARRPVPEPPMIDLHSHSTASDGTDPPAEVGGVWARRQGCRPSRTDHDTLEHLPEARVPPPANRASASSTPARSRASSRARPGTMHLLVYFVDDSPGPLQDRLGELQAGRGNRNEQIVECLRANGMDVAVDEILAEAGGDRSAGRTSPAS